jgi:hypothetical protein
MEFSDINVPRVAGNSWEGWDFQSNNLGRIHQR